MADKLEVTIAQVADYYQVTASMIQTEKLPTKIFLYENNGTATLGNYIGVCHVADLGKRKEWEGVAIPSFGNKYVRHDIVSITVSDSDSAARVAANILAGVRRLKQTFAEPPAVTTTYDI